MTPNQNARNRADLNPKEVADAAVVPETLDCSYAKLNQWPKLGVPATLRDDEIEIRELPQDAPSSFPPIDSSAAQRPQLEARWLAEEQWSRLSVEQQNKEIRAAHAEKQAAESEAEGTPARKALAAASLAYLLTRWSHLTALRIAEKTELLHAYTLPGDENIPEQIVDHLAKLPDGPESNTGISLLTKLVETIPVQTEWDVRRYVNLPASLATTRHVVTARELPNGQTALPFDFDLPQRAAQTPTDELRFEVSYLPDLKLEPSRFVPSALLNLWNTGIDRSRYGSVPIARRVGLEVLLAVPPTHRADEAVLLGTKMGELAGGIWPGTTYRPRTHGPILVDALHTVHNGKVAWSLGERSALRVLVAVRDWPRSYDFDALLSFESRLPPGSRQGPQVDRVPMRETWNSYRHHRLLLTAYCLFDSYATVKGTLVNPLVPAKVLTNAAGYAVSTTGRVLTYRNRPTRSTTHPQAVQIGTEFDPRSDLDRYYPWLEGKDIILLCYPTVGDTLEERRDQRRRTKETLTAARQAGHLRFEVRYRKVRGGEELAAVRLMPSEEYRKAHAARWAANKHGSLS